MPNDSNVSLFLAVGRNQPFDLPAKWWGCDSFPKHLDLALAPNKTNEGVKKQWNTRYHDKSQHIVTCLAVFRLYTFSLVRWQLKTEIEWRWGSWQMLNPLNSFDGPCPWFSEAKGLAQWAVLYWRRINHQNYDPRSSQNRAPKNWK